MLLAVMADVARLPGSPGAAEGKVLTDAALATADTPLVFLARTCKV